MRLEAEVLNLRTKHPFIIARGGKTECPTVWIRLIDDDGTEGWGEATPSTYYGETAQTVLAALEKYVTVLPDDPMNLDDAERALESVQGHNPSARAGISGALHDLVGKKLGIPVYQLWGLDPAKAPQSTFTIGIDTVEMMQQKVAEAAQYPILKVKLGAGKVRDFEILETIRNATDSELRVDANAGWTVKYAIQMLPVLAEFGVTVLEQPLAPHDLEGFRLLRHHSTIPVIADESCLVASDVPKLVGLVDGVNIKLAKCGSLREAIRIIHVARANAMMVMVGCMIESSIGITQAAHFTPLVDIVDLDGAALLEHDPFVGATIDGGQVTLPTGPGLGLSRR